MDLEAPPPPPPSEDTPLVASNADSNNGTIPRTSPSISSTDSTSLATDSSIDDLKEELERPWPATFDRGIQILAGPVLDEAKAASYTKSPSVRARYKKNNLNQLRGYHTPEPATSLFSSPGTPAWFKKGLVRIKSLDYTFDDQNTAIPTPPKPGRGVNRQKQQLDAQAYRQKILAKRGGNGGLSSSSGNFDIDQAELRKSKDSGQDFTKSPGFRREKQMDRQRKKEKKVEEKVGSKEHDHKSTFSQCTFNMANILMGVGMLGLPFVFKSAGWIGGTCVTVSFCLVTWRTSYYLGRELNGDPRPVHLFDGSDKTITRMRKQINSFPDIAREAFGNNGCICLSAVLYFELFSCLSIFFVSLGDHLHALFPSVSQSKHMTIVAGILTVPSALLRTPKLLSYLSAVGTFATVAVVSSVVLSALVMFSIAGAAGTEREYKLYSNDGLPLAMGIVAYCFSGHAIVPSIYSSMQRPQEFERMIDLTYGVVLLSCLLVAISGYYMFGDDVEDQITISLEKESESADILMTALTWLMILTAISKFTLTMFPLALGFEEMLTGVLPSDLAMELIDSMVKLVLIFLALAVAIFFPSFSFLCSLVGLICTMIVSVVFPALAHLKLFGTKLSMLDKAIDWFLVVGGSVVAILGTIATVKDDI
eukprot:CAMPEP_0183716206 /NCGR_PEP_ID=MMETSP0737-20130205/10193_1 /TAXON_ID=385413 /ORGANISM="Thalassiosira miniscula, Strain CCMP1093" /LENGTH=648 /DNA_ID=CAMNT_0025945439 /DNA_START=297 /DNA_END=2243 /DNA_ORIENTATION=+